MIKEKIIKIGNINIANNLPFVLFGGMNVLETRDLAMHICEHYIKITDKLKIPYIFKASFDKANRSSLNSYRGPGIKEGIKIFKELKQNFGVKIVTDVHEISQVKPISKIVDVIQLPAFLGRQTDLIQAIAKTGLAVNVKKPQFLSPNQMGNVIEKFVQNGNSNIILCERGSTFGYDNLIVDMLGFGIMKKISQNTPIIFDVTHSLQTREPFSKISSGRSSQLEELGRAGIAIGIAGLFIEAHSNPEKAKCDGKSAIQLNKLETFLMQIKEIDEIVKNFAKINNIYSN